VKFSRRDFLLLGSGVAVSAGCDTSLSEHLWPYTGGPDRENTAFSPPDSEAVDLVSHCLNRLSFGPRPARQIRYSPFQNKPAEIDRHPPFYRSCDYQRLSALGETPEEAVSAYVEEQLQPGKIDDSLAEFALRRFQTIHQPIGELFEYQEKFLLSQLTLATLIRAVVSERQLQEVMVQFWTDHFNIDQSKGDCRWLKVWDDQEVIRQHALGKFPELLKASALSPAMLWYLDGRENIKQKPDDQPNENYARELLELHTLGVNGGYGQQDVAEVARCLTGWRVQSKKSGKFLISGLGQVEFDQHLHDDEKKSVLGQIIQAGLGEQDLDRVLGIVGLHPSTAEHLATKLCRRFIADEPPSGAVQSVAASFLRSEGDIGQTLHTLFQTDEFQQHRSNKFKRPFNFLVSALRATGATVGPNPESWHLEDQPLCDYLLRMGDAPFQYPSPDGYPQVMIPWLGTLLWRWDFALKLSQNHLPGIRIDRQEDLEAHAGGAEKLLAHVFGRQADQTELKAYRQSENGLALVLAGPAFQMC